MASAWSGMTVIEIRGFSGKRLTSRILSSGRKAPLQWSGERPGLLWNRGGETDYQAAVREFIGSYSQRGLLIVISDFLDDKKLRARLAVSRRFPQA